MTREYDRIPYLIAYQNDSGVRDVYGGVAELVVLESHLLRGNQPIAERETLNYGQSITDACLSLAETVPLLEQLAAAVRRSQ